MEALGYIHKKLQLIDNDTEILSSKASVVLKMGNYKEAIDTYDILEKRTTGERFAYIRFIGLWNLKKDINSTF